MENESNEKQTKKRKPYVSPKVSEPEVTTRMVLAALGFAALSGMFALAANQEMRGGDELSKTEALPQIEETISEPSSNSSELI